MRLTEKPYSLATTLDCMKNTAHSMGENLRQIKWEEEKKREKKKDNWQLHTFYIQASIDPSTSAFTCSSNHPASMAYKTEVGVLLLRQSHPL